MHSTSFPQVKSQHCISSSQLQNRGRMQKKCSTKLRVQEHGNSPEAIKNYFNKCSKDKHCRFPADYFNRVLSKITKMVKAQLMPPTSLIFNAFRVHSVLIVNFSRIPYLLQPLLAQRSNAQRFFKILLYLIVHSGTEVINFSQLQEVFL